MPFNLNLLNVSHLICVLFTYKVKRLKEAEENVEHEEDHPIGLELRLCPKCHVSLNEHDGVYRSISDTYTLPLRSQT